MTNSDLRAAIETAETVEAVVEVLISQARVAWVLKHEDARLSELGYRSHRPDPAAAYAHAGIELLETD